MIHVEQKKYPQKQGKKLGESNKWKQHKHPSKQRRKQKKQATLKKWCLPYKKTKQTPFIVSFIMISDGFLGFLKKNKQKEDNFIV